MAIDETQVEQSAEETAEVEEETTTEVAEEAEATEAAEETSEETDTDEDLEQIRKDAKAFQDQKRRAEKAEKELKDLKAKKGKGDDKEPDPTYTALEQRVIRAELAAAGVKHPDDQQYVIDAAQRLGVEPSEAISDEIVAAKLKRMTDTRKTKDATPAPRGRGGQGSSTDVGRLADKVTQGAALPTDPALAEKVQAEIARRAQSAA